jgi:hypothetical protein
MFKGWRVRWTTWIWTRLLFTADRLFGTSTVEWELARRERQIDGLVADIRAVDEDLDALAEELAFCRMVLCLAELKARSERDDVDDWLRFVPHTDGEEVLLDNLIESLVKDRLATVDAQPTASGHYVYQLWPDWPAIMSHLRHSSMPQELRCWLETQA